jgi:hypothetical protein
MPQQTTNSALSDPIPDQRSEVRRRPLTAWELPKLLTPMHRYKRRKRKPAVERAHHGAILAFVHRNRFVIANQVQRRFPEFLPSDRTARRHLEELETLGLLGIAPARGVSPLFPKVFYVTGKGISKLRESLSAKGKCWNAVRVDRRGRQSLEGFSAEHVVHELFTTEFLLGLWQTVHGRPDLELLTVQRRSLATHSAFRVNVAGRAGRVIPDALFLFRQRDAGMICCLLEIDLASMNRKQLRTKFGRYAAWAQSAAGQQYLIDLYQRHGAKDPKPAFRLLVVARSRTEAGDEGRLMELLTAVKQEPAGIENRLWLTTAATLCERQHEALPLDGNLWLRARDLDWPLAKRWQTRLEAVQRHSLWM